MRVFHETVGGEPVTIYVVQHAEDLDQFRDFVRRHLRALAFDTETTGLNLWSPEFRLRLAQFGTDREAWVIPVEHGGRFAEDARRTLRAVRQLVIHNASYDLLVVDRHLGVPMEELWPKTLDTRIIAHLVDPRGRDEGGIGHSLEALVEHHIDTTVAQDIKGLMRTLARELKTTLSKVWATVDLDHPDYNRYAGMDPILTARLARTLLPKVPVSARRLVPFEHSVAEICSHMEREGFLLDVEYTQELSTRLQQGEEQHKETARELGCENVNSTEMVADALEKMGVKILGRTPSGRRQVDKTLLNQLSQAGNPLATAVKEAKKAGKWRKTWVDGFLAARDGNDRCHASIQSLRARTARMSITGIPAQTLPAGDSIIRRCFLADAGHVIASVDYQAQELRVLAALSGDRTMINAFRDGADLHMLTAKAAFGEEASDKHRKIAKTVNFGRVYGGGAKTVSTQTGIDLAIAKRVVEAFDRRYPGVAKLSERLQAQARRQGYITTPSGRRLPVDRSRAYSALNYLVQSTSRDVTCRGLIRLHRAGYTRYLRLPIHDEVVASLPAAKAEWGAKEIARHMAEDMGPVHIGTDPEVGGRSWGSLYGADY
ncbi:hypothetical protein GCM10012275_07730 [Longimycelium tulufanense]|uniref:DNA polymerase I n=1 Tax=Longimycelium tulufanense TaxID=907463 RepID=A0A8J3FTF6_9PSEU|nr:DNA polymerase [Longimycelium tulufanense]GGM39271.1 hypothetical protein GCM10012275_07730 [Longimycelium tulufanense]